MRQWINLVESIVLAELFNSQIVEGASDPGFRPIKNPSDKQIVQMLQRSKEHRLRGVTFGQDFWLWDAYYAIHGEGANAIGVPYWPDENDNRLVVNEDDGFPVFDFTADDDSILKLLVTRFKNSDDVLFPFGSMGLLSGKEAYNELFNKNIVEDQNLTPTDEFLAYLKQITQRDPVDKVARCYGAATIFLSKSRNYPDSAVYFDDIKTADKGRKQGGRALAMVCRLADRCGVRIELLAKAFGEGGMTTPELVKWYSKYGFEPTGWIGQGGSTEMIRIPKS